jgi:hypothetical protein
MAGQQDFANQQYPTTAFEEWANEPFFEKEDKKFESKTE